MEFAVFQILFSLTFVLIFGMFIFGCIQGISQWHKNNNSPRLSVHAVIVSKRQNVSHHNHLNADSTMHHSTSTTYYVTFEVASGGRMEFGVSGREYGMLAEGDRGTLQFQGTRYLSFERAQK